MNAATCKTCPYWDEYQTCDACHDADDVNTMGDCRRRAPTMIATRAEDPRNAADFNSLFPYTMSDEWCGEHPDRDATRRAAQAQGAKP